MGQQFFAEFMLQQLPDASVPPTPPTPELVGIRTLFPHLDVETEIQINDKTRLDGSKSFSLSGVTTFDYLAIRPGADEVKVDVFNTDPKKRYLDWEFLDWKQDIDSTNNKIDFDETGVTLSATLVSGTYDRDELATEIQTQLNAVGALTYTVSFDETDKLTILATGNFSLIYDGPNQEKLAEVLSYFDQDAVTGSSSYTSHRVEKLSRKVTIYAGENRFNVQNITCVANTSNALNNKYFFLYSAGNEEQYYVWFNSSSLGTDPNIQDYTGIEVQITNGDTASAVALALSIELEAIVGISASASNAIVTVTNDSVGWCTPASDGVTTGFSYSTVTEGQFQSTDSVFVGVYSVNGDYLFCDDSDLMQFESEIRRWVPDGRNSFLNVHRQAQKHIIEYLDRSGFVNSNGDKYTKFDLLDKSEVKEWARFTALRMIFENVKNSQDDVFQTKRQTYQTKEDYARNRAILRIDKNKSGQLSKENLNHSVTLGRS